MVTTSTGRHGHSFTIKMRRSRTSVQLKKQDMRANLTTTLPQKSVAKQLISQWNAHQYRGVSARSSSQTRRKEENTHNNRRRSIDCTYNVWKLSDSADCARNGGIVDITAPLKDTGRKPSYIFPPIRNKSPQRNFSAKYRPPRERSPKSSSLKLNSFLNGKESNSPNKETTLKESRNAEFSETFCHGLRDNTALRPEDFIPEDNEVYWNPKFSHQINPDDVIKPPITPINRASSLHSRSSDGSCSSSAFRAKFSSRRRLSLPVQSTLPTALLEMSPGKSPEFHQAYKELSIKDGEYSARRRMHTTTSNKELSDKLTTSSTNTTKDAVVSFSVSSGIRRDSLHRIEEIPVELITPVMTVQEETNQVEETKDNDVGGAKTINDAAKSKSAEIRGNDIPVREATPDKIETETQKETCKVLFTSKQDSGQPLMAIKKSSSGLNGIERQLPDDKPVHTAGGTKRKGSSVNNVENIETKCSERAEQPRNCDSITVDSKSLIDTSLLDESDDDLCDSDFREKRIIQWLIKAESGDKVDKVIEQAIAPSPTNGSRETAITVIYSGK